VKQRVHTHYLSSSFAYLLIGLRDGSWMVSRSVALFDRIRGWPYCFSGGHGLVNFTKHSVSGSGIWWKSSWNLKRDWWKIQC